MVSTATPAVRANCSIRYSTSPYSNDGSELGGLAERVPVVDPVEPDRVGAEGSRERLHGVDVVEVQVVVVDRVAHVVRRAVVGQVAGRGEDRVVRVHDVAALAELLPGGGLELHRAQRTRGRRAVDAAEVALDVVDRGQVAAVDPVGARGLE